MRFRKSINGLNDALGVMVIPSVHYEKFPRANNYSSFAAVCKLIPS